MTNERVPAELMYLQDDLIGKQLNTLLQIKQSVLDKLMTRPSVILMGGIQKDYGAASDTWISPLGQNVPFTALTLQAKENLTLVSATPTYTGSGTTPQIILFKNLGNGLHKITLDPAPESGQWLKLNLNVQGPNAATPKTLDIWVAHLPCDINQDTKVDIYDGTVFGLEWKGARRAALLDINGDTKVDIRDVTSFAGHYNGVPAAIKSWKTLSLPPKP
jgi:hypothetical protein